MISGFVTEDAWSATSPFIRSEGAGSVISHCGRMPGLTVRSVVLVIQLDSGRGRCKMQECPKEVAPFALAGQMLSSFRVGF